MAWAHFDLWSKSCSWGLMGVRLVWSGLVSPPAAPNSPPSVCLCVHSTLRPACVIICNFAAKKKKKKLKEKMKEKKKNTPRQSSSELTISTELGHRATWNGQQRAAVRERGGGGSVSHGDDF